jgi:hypothetical protein
VTDDERRAPTEEENRVLNLANQAVRAAMREDWDLATSAMQLISDESGGHGTLLALVAWCDWLIISQNRARGRPDHEAAELARPVWVQPRTGRIVTDAGGVPPAVAWAGQLVAARAAMDMPSFNALLSAMPADSQGRGKYAGALLEACAIEMRAMQGGMS